MARIRCKIKITWINPLSINISDKWFIFDSVTLSTFESNVLTLSKLFQRWFGFRNFGFYCIHIVVQFSRALKPAIRISLSSIISSISFWAGSVGSSSVISSFVSISWQVVKPQPSTCIWVGVMETFDWRYFELKLKMNFNC